MYKLRDCKNIEKSGHGNGTAVIVPDFKSKGLELKLHKSTIGRGQNEIIKSNFIVLHFCR